MTTRNMSDLTWTPTAPQPGRVDTCQGEHVFTDYDGAYLAADCTRHARWLHVTHHDMRLEPVDGPDHAVSVLTLCPQHSAEAMAADGEDPTLTDARYELLP